MSDIEIGSVWVSKKDEATLLMVSNIEGLKLETHWLSTPHNKFWFNMYDFLNKYEPFEVDKKDDIPKAVQILNEAVAIMAERGKSYEKSGGEAERSMPKIVAMFNALTGHELTPAQGWKFMACLKLARSEQGEHREDNYLDGAAYFALAGEEAGENEQ